MSAYVLTNTGKSMITNILSGNSVVYYCASGLNPSGLTSAATDVALFYEINPRVIGTTSFIETTTPNDTLEITGTYSPTSAVTIAEAAVSDSFTTPVVGIVQPSSTVIGSTSGTSVVSNTVLSPGNGNYIQIRTEVMKVTAGSGTTTLTVQRAQNGTTSISTIASNDSIGQGNIPGASEIVGGNLLAKANFPGIPLVEGDLLVYTWTFNFQ